jgi:hypothetical protein
MLFLLHWARTSRARLSNRNFTVATAVPAFPKRRFGRVKGEAGARLPGLWVLSRRRLWKFTPVVGVGNEVLFRGMERRAVKGEEFVRGFRALQSPASRMA